MSNMSRLSHIISTPRASMPTIVLLVVFLVAFCLMLAGVVPEQAAAAPPEDGDASRSTVNWLFSN